MTLFMISNKKVNSIFILIFICTSGFGQNHRQFANWICGDFSINKKVNEVDVKIASSHIVNLSNVDSSNYWVVEDMNIDKVKKQRILHLHLLDSGYVVLDIYELKNNKPFVFRLGDNREDTIPGHYGYNYNFTIKTIFTP